jgi:hypothetical protein
MIKKLLFLLGFIVCAQSAHATWSVLQHPEFSCSSTTTCTITPTALTGGSSNPVVIIGHFYSPTAAPALTGISAGGTFVIPSGGNACAGFASVTVDTGAGIACGYIAAPTAGVSSIVVSYTGGLAIAGDVYIDLIELHTTLTAVFDAAGNGASAGTPASNVSGVALTLSGSNDAIVQAFSPFTSGPTAISGAYTAFFDTPLSFYAVAGAINTSVGTAPAWTNGSTQYALTAIAFKETGGGGGVQRMRGSVISK